MKLFLKTFLLSLFFLGLFACGQGSQPQKAPLTVGEEATTLGRMVRDARWIGEVRALKVEPWKNRKDWEIVSLQAEKSLKGEAPKKFTLLDVKLFPGETEHFAPGQKSLVFIKELPAYTAWQEVLRSGTRYSLLGRSKGLVEEGQAEIGDFVQAVLKLKPDSPEMREFILKTLEANGTPRLREDLSREIFDRDLFPFELREEDWLRLGALVKRGDFPDSGKKELVLGIASRPGEVSNRLLREFFCLSPSSVCLKSAETLESRGLPIPLEDYTRALQTAPPELKAGLFAILGRHHRVESLPLFESYLQAEKNEKTASSILESLGEIGDLQALPLVFRYKDDPRYYVRAAVLVALGKLKSDEGIAVLENALKTNDPSLIALAAQALQRIGSPKALQTLARHFERGHHGHWEPSEPPQHFSPGGSSPAP